MKRLLSLALFVTWMLFCVSPSKAQGYIAHVLNSAPGTDAFATDINDIGEIVGSVSGGTPYSQRAILWNQYSAVGQSLDEGNRVAHARLINNRGLVIGEHDSPPGCSNAFMWSSANGVTNLDWFPVVEALNMDGIMVGWKSSGDVDQVPVAVDTEGNVSYLDYSFGDGGRAVDINDSGYIVGDSYDFATGGRATLWHAGQETVDLGVFTGTWSTAMGINNAGQVVGYYGNESGDSGSFIWCRDKQTVFIPACSLLDDGTFVPKDINDNGLVLGSANISGVGNIVTWSETGGFTIVGPGMANAINNSGWIVGAYDLNDPRAIVWEPVPEPSSLLALAGGLGGLAIIRRRRRSEGKPSKVFSAA